VTQANAGWRSMTPVLSGFGGGLGKSGAGLALGFCFVLAAFPCSAAPVPAASAAPPLPERNPKLNAVTQAEAPKEAEAPPPKPALPPLPGERATVPWTDAEIAAAKQDCDRLLASLKIDYRTLPPIRKGVCGAPAPILVTSIGNDPKVAIDPPATMRCPLAAALSRWLSEVVQPEAMQQLGAPVVKLVNEASYDCRNRYGARVGRLSEHALADAIDISDFALRSGTQVTVLGAWPKPGRNGPKLAEAKATPAVARTAESAAETAVKPDAASAAPPLPERRPLPGAAASSKTPASGMLLARAKAHGLAAIKLKAPSAAPPLPPKPAAGPDPQARFIVAVHDGACRYFGTVLGPGANAAHNAHFHLDMIKRKTCYCQ
jgi:hypothetical protein